MAPDFLDPDQLFAVPAMDSLHPDPIASPDFTAANPAPEFHPPDLHLSDFQLAGPPDPIRFEGRGPDLNAAGGLGADQIYVRDGQGSQAQQVLHQAGIEVIGSGHVMMQPTEPISRTGEDNPES